MAPQSYQPARPPHPGPPPPQELDWCAAFPAAPLSGHLRAFQRLLAEYEAAREAAAQAAQRAATLEAEVPDEFLDPITMTLMHEPVVLPDSQVRARAVCPPRRPAAGPAGRLWAALVVPQTHCRREGRGQLAGRGPAHVVAVPDLPWAISSR